MRRTERRAAVVAEGLRRAATGCAKLILQPSNLNDSAEEIVHSWLGARSSSWGDELALDLALRIESKARPTTAQQAFEDQVQGALNVGHEIWRAPELVMAALWGGVHTFRF